MSLPRAPEHLSDDAKRIWDSIQREFLVDDAAGVAILQSALEAWDRAAAARRDIEKRGMMYQDRFGQVKMHPLMPVERDARAAFLQGLKQLGLEPDPGKKKQGRPGAFLEFKKKGVSL